MSPAAQPPGTPRWLDWSRPGTIGTWTGKASIPITQRAARYAGLA